MHPFVSGNDFPAQNRDHASPNDLIAFHVDLLLKALFQYSPHPHPYANEQERIAQPTHQYHDHKAVQRPRRTDSADRRPATPDWDSITRVQDAQPLSLDLSRLTAIPDLIHSPAMSSPSDFAAMLSLSAPSSYSSDSFCLILYERGDQAIIWLMETQRVFVAGDWIEAQAQEGSPLSDWASCPATEDFENFGSDEWVMDL